MIVFRTLIVVCFCLFIVSCSPFDFLHREAEHSKVEQDSSSPNTPNENASSDEVRSEESDEPQSTKHKSLTRFYELLKSEEFNQFVLEDHFVLPFARSLEGKSFSVVSYEKDFAKISSINAMNGTEGFSMKLPLDQGKLPAKMTSFMEETVKTGELLSMSDMVKIELGESFTGPDGKTYMLATEKLWNGDFLVIEEKNSGMSWIVERGEFSPKFTLYDVHNGNDMRMFLKHTKDEKLGSEMISFHELTKERSIQWLNEKISPLVQDGHCIYPDVSIRSQAFVIGTPSEKGTDSYKDWVLMNNDGKIEFHGNDAGISNGQGELITDKKASASYYVFHFVEDGLLVPPTVIIDQFLADSNRLVKTFEYEWNRYLDRYELL